MNNRNIDIRSRSGVERAKLAAFILSEVLVLVAGVTVLVKNERETFFLDFGSSVQAVFFTCLPILAERLFHFRMVLPLFLFCQVYTLGNTVGEILKLYYITVWWDKFMHFCGGVVFALIGVMLLKAISKKYNMKPIIYAVFALCFSMAIALLWEFYEFGIDCFFGQDMQHDTWITSISSHELASFVGGVDGFDNIKQVVIDGTPLPFEGYLDIGLYDTMFDMLFGTIGALLLSASYVITKGKLIYPAPGAEINKDVPDLIPDEENSQQNVYSTQ